MTIKLEPGPANPVQVRRTGPGTFMAHNPRGAQVSIAATEVDGAHFTPGELLKVALAACSAVTAEAPLVRALGEDVDVEVRAAGPSGDRRYPTLVEEIIVNLSPLDEAQRRRVLTVVQRAVDGHCTVGRTLQVGAAVELNIRES